MEQIIAHQFQAIARTTPAISADYFMDLLTRQQIRDMWLTRWQRCNLMCKIGIGWYFAMLLSHYGFMYWQLHHWADGALMLILMTIGTTIQTFLSIMLMEGEPMWMMAPRWMRRWSFISAFLSCVGFVGQFIFLVVEYFKGRNPFEDLTTMVIAYMFIPRATDVFPSAYIVIFDGLGQSDYALYSPNYGKWKT